MEEEPEMLGREKRKVHYRNAEHLFPPVPKMYLFEGETSQRATGRVKLVIYIPLVCQGSSSTDLFPHFIQAVAACDCLAEIIRRKHFNHKALN